MEGQGSPVTRMLAAFGAVGAGSPDQLLPLVYEELRSVAHARLRHERPGLTLQATALVHEAYLRLVAHDQAAFANRAHFFAAASEAMRRILVERARRVGAAKHGGDRHRVELGDGGADASAGASDVVERDADAADRDELLALDAALSRLEAIDAKMAEVVKLRSFAGLTVEQCAEAMGTSVRSVERRWTSARAWLQREMTRG